MQTSNTQTVSATHTVGLRINAHKWFQDEAFIEWLNSPEADVMTWHTKGDLIGEYSDVVVLVDGSLNGEGSDAFYMPEAIWNEIVEVCREHFSPDPSMHFHVHLTPLEA